VVQRVTRTGFPVDLIPTEITSITVTPDVDAENTLRTAVLEFIDTLRGVERAIAWERRSADVPAELDVAPLGTISEQEWRACWPPVDAPEPELEQVSTDEPTAQAEESTAESP
jgi:XTP/dITP diphosphohydrolase